MKCLLISIFLLSIALRVICCISVAISDQNPSEYIIKSTHEIWSCPRGLLGLFYPTDGETYHEKIDSNTLDSLKIIQQSKTIKQLSKSLEDGKIKTELAFKISNALKNHISPQDSKISKILSNYGNCTEYIYWVLYDYKYGEKSIFKNKNYDDLTVDEILKEANDINDTFYDDDELTDLDVFDIDSDLEISDVETDVDYDSDIEVNIYDNGILV